MASKFFQFFWDVPGSGYEWAPVPGDGSGAVYLAEKELRRASRTMRRYDPLKGGSAFFQTFAHTKPTKDAILKFANKHGALSVGRTPLSWRAGEGDQITTKFVGHTFEDWKTEIRAMNDAIRLWEAARTENLDELKLAICWDGDRSVSFTGWDSPSSKTRREILIASRDYRSELFANVQPSELKNPALFCVQKIINDNLEGRVSPRMLWDNGRLNFFYLPTDLAGALWLRFSLAVTRLDNPEFRRCGYCDNWIELSKKGARKSRLYCSDSCRVSAHRKKRKSNERTH